MLFRLLFLSGFFLTSLWSQSPSNLYQIPLSEPRSFYEQGLLDHIRQSIEKAKSLDSKLSDQNFEEVPTSKNWRKKHFPQSKYLHEINGVPYYHLLNNLCELSGGSHLHVGLLTGNSYIAALFQNDEFLDYHVGIDWFRDCPKEIFLQNCEKYLTLQPNILRAQCFCLDKNFFQKPFDIYFYDADHSERGQELAILYYDSLLADLFILVIDDWNIETTRLATFRVFEKKKYKLLHQEVIGNKEKTQYVALIRKSTLE